jgi:hypothetical protein
LLRAKVAFDDRHVRLDCAAGSSSTAAPTHFNNGIKENENLVRYDGDRPLMSFARRKLAIRAVVHDLTSPIGRGIRVNSDDRDGAASRSTD